MLRNISLAIAAIMFVAVLAFGTEYWHYEDLNQSQTWVTGDTHHIMGDLHILSGVQITIQYGVVVDFDTDGLYFCGLTIDAGATLQANGIVNNPVLFTVDHGTQPGSWKALIAQGGQNNPATMNLTNCEIRYGGMAEAGILQTDGVIQCLADFYQYDFNVNINHCYIHDNSGSGICAYHGNGQENECFLTAMDNRIENCAVGVKVSINLTQDSKINRNFVVACTTGMKFHVEPCFSVKNNIIKNSLTQGVYAEYSPGNFFNNVIDSTGEEEDGIHILNPPEGSYIANNIITRCSGYAIYGDGGDNPTVSNCCYQAPTEGVDPEGTVSEDPNFVAGFGDENYYHLRWDSPCLGAGVTGTAMTNCNPAQSTSDIGSYGGPWILKMSAYDYIIMTTQTASR